MFSLFSHYFSNYLKCPLTAFIDSSKIVLLSTNPFIFLFLHDSLAIPKIYRHKCSKFKNELTEHLLLVDDILLNQNVPAPMTNAFVTIPNATKFALQWNMFFVVILLSTQRAMLNFFYFSCKCLIKNSCVAEYLRSS
jgi:hypothetical protein